MTTGSPVHDFKTLILSFHPVIAIETVEEDRAADLVRRVAAELNMPVFVAMVLMNLPPLLGGVPSPGGPRRRIQCEDTYLTC